MKTPNLDLILATMEPDELGKNLTGFGVNLICPEPSIYAPSIARVFSLNLIRVDEFYALLTWDDNANFGDLIQAHSEFSYENPLLPIFWGQQTTWLRRRASFV